ncbi:hypothetical protein [Gulosibacter faecalis]|uniref:DUF559 domain-containing protein n=2 Tax=Gulosibacter faecalis TaxID=272240 RepID=A0ABW5UY02_9MICO
MGWNLRMMIYETGETAAPLDASARQSLRLARASEFLQVYPGYYVQAADPRPSAELLHAARTLAAARENHQGVVSGISAAVLHGLPLTRKRLGTKVQFTRPWFGRANEWVRTSEARLDETEAEFRAGARVTTLRRTVRDLAVVLPADELLAVADVALQWGADLRDLAVPGAPHARKLRWVCEHADARSESIGESRSRALLLERGFAWDTLQPNVLDAHGRWLARADFGLACGLLGEFDGRSKYGRLLRPGQDSSGAIMREKNRENSLRDAGWEIVRWGWDDLSRPEVIVTRIRAALDRLSKTPPRGSLAVARSNVLDRPDWSQKLTFTRSLPPRPEPARASVRTAPDKPDAT